MKYIVRFASIFVVMTSLFLVGQWLLPKTWGYKDVQDVVEGKRIDSIRRGCTGYWYNTNVYILTLIQEENDVRYELPVSSDN